MNVLRIPLLIIIAREYFHVLIYNSFYSLYHDLFLDSGVHGILPTVSYSFPSQSNLFDMSIFGEINFKHNIYEVGFDALSLSSLAWEKYMPQDDSRQFIFEKDNAFIMEIEDSILHIHSLIRLNSHDSTAHLEPIHLMKRNAQLTNNLISIMNPGMMCLSIVDLTHQSDNLDSEFHDRIEDWLHNSYLKNLQSNGKVMLTLFLIENLGGKHDMFFHILHAKKFVNRWRIVKRMGNFHLGRWLYQVPIILASFRNLVTFFHAFVICIVTELHIRWRVHILKHFDRMVRIYLLCF
jgi:hypothetical protein